MQYNYVILHQFQPFSYSFLCLPTRWPLFYDDEWMRLKNELLNYGVDLHKIKCLFIITIWLSSFLYLTWKFIHRVSICVKGELSHHLLFLLTGILLLMLLCLLLYDMHEPHNNMQLMAIIKWFFTFLCMYCYHGIATGT